MAGINVVSNCRDEVRALDLKEERADQSVLLSTLDQVLFHTPNTNDTNYQEFLQSSRLIPSFYDRRPYFGLISKDSNNSVSESEDASYQLMAKKLFTSRIQEEVARLKVTNIFLLSSLYILLLLVHTYYTYYIQHSTYVEL